MRRLRWAVAGRSMLTWCRLPAPLSLQNHAVVRIDQLRVCVRRLCWLDQPPTDEVRRLGVRTQCADERSANGHTVHSTRKHRGDCWPTNDGQRHGKYGLVRQTPRLLHTLCSTHTDLAPGK